MIKYRVILSKKNAITIFIRYFENDAILGITIYYQTIFSALARTPCWSPTWCNIQGPTGTVYCSTSRPSWSCSPTMSSWPSSKSQEPCPSCSALNWLERELLPQLLCSIVDICSRVSSSLQELQNRASKEVGTVMCYVCDFDMCFPHLDSVNISCQCFVGEDSR